MGGSAEPRPRFRGRPIEARPGESLASALARGRPPILQRSVRYHRPRAPMCGLGYCTGCLVRVNGVPNVRACRYVPAPGDRIRTENAWPSPAFDLLGVLDRLFPRGLDTLHGFRRPAFAAPLYHRVVRRLAGFGRAPDPPGAPMKPGRTVTTGVAIVGAGTAGRAAHAELLAAGVDHLVVDRDPAPGVAAPQRLESAEAVFLPPPRPGRDRPFRLVVVRPGGEGMWVEAGKLLVACGGYDASLLFGGSDRPGVLTADGAFALARARDDPPFRRALLFGGGERAAELLDAFGAHVEAVVAPGAIGSEVSRRASELSVPMYPRSLLIEARGARAVRSAVIARRGDATRVTLPVDSVLLAHRRLPSPQLLFQAGASMAYHASVGAYFPIVTDAGATTVPGLFAAGLVAGAPDAAAAQAHGRSAARAAMGTAAPAPAGAPGPAEAANELQGYYRELLPHAGGRSKWVVCPCEDVLLRELEEAHRAGYRGVEVVKRYTGLGTGLCQGRYCVPEALLLLANWEGRPPSEVGYLTQRPPVVPAPLGALAGLPETVEAPEARA